MQLRYEAVHLPGEKIVHQFCKSEYNKEYNITLKCYIDVMQYITCKLIYFSINLSIPEGHLVAIVGPVGAGKSSMASTLLGETVRRQGSTVVNVGIEY